MGESLSDEDFAFAAGPVRAMPVSFSGDQQPHSQKNLTPLPMAMIVKSLSRKEVAESPEAEWKKLRDEDGGKGCWGEFKTTEYIQSVEPARN